VDIFEDLAAEENRLETILAGLDRGSWEAPSAAEGWRVVDVVLHLAQTEEAVIATTAGGPAAFARWERGDGSLDALMDQAVRAERAAPEVVFERWRVARRAALAAMQRADPGQRFVWASAPLRPPVLATTRLAEHWAHGLDVATPFGIDYPDTDRLRHIAWLAHRTLPYAFGLAGEPAVPVHCELSSPDGGATWRYGPQDAESRIAGPAGAFCRVAARRLPAEESGLVATGPHAAAALRVLRTYAA
jgi:uncharacterized protein (TIGR03084 family)